MNIVVPQESRSDFVALCRRWRDEHRALADDLLARRSKHHELCAGQWRDVTLDDADRHARIAAELEAVMAELGVARRAVPADRP